MEALLCEAGPGVEFYPGPRSPESPVLVLNKENAGLTTRQPQQLAGSKADDMTRRARFQPHDGEREHGSIDEDARALEREGSRLCRLQIGTRSAPGEAGPIDRAVL